MSAKGGGLSTPKAANYGRGVRCLVALVAKGRKEQLKTKLSRLQDAGQLAFSSSIGANPLRAERSSVRARPSEADTAGRFRPDRVPLRASLLQHRLAAF